MNILVINWRDVTHPWAGGAERHIHEMSKYWCKKGHKVSHLVGGYRGAPKFENIDGIDILRYGNTYSIFFIAPFIFLAKLRKSYDVVIEVAHGLPFFAALFTHLPKLLIIHHDHKKLWQTEFPKLVSALGIFVEEKIIPLLYRNENVVLLSDFARKELEKKGFRKMHVINPGIGTEHYKPGKSKTPYPSLLYLGRLRRYKRIDLLIDSFNEVAAKYPKAKLIIAGNGQDKNRLTKYAQKKYPKSMIEFVGFVPEKKKMSLLQKCWLLAFPSVIEGWGLVALEASACGTPVVGFRVPGVSESVKHGFSGLLSKSREEFTSNLARLLGDSRLRTGLSANARLWAKRFSWKRCSERYLRLMEKAIAPYGKQHAYDDKYFSHPLRQAHKRKFHPVYSFRHWYISKYLQPNKIVDIGFGNGLILEMFAEDGLDYHGIDISKSALARLPKHIKSRCRIGSIESIPYDDSEFDTVLCIDVLEHIRKDRLKKAIRECARISSNTIYFDITCLEDIFFIFSDSTHVAKMFSWDWLATLRNTLGSGWDVNRGPILPFIHHGIFIAKKNENKTA